jgi:hypothetical protein
MLPQGRPVLQRVTDRNVGQLPALRHHDLGQVVHGPASSQRSPAGWAGQRLQSRESLGVAHEREALLHVPRPPSHLPGQRRAQHVGEDKAHQPRADDWRGHSRTRGGDPLGRHPAPLHSRCRRGACVPPLLPGDAGELLEPAEDLPCAGDPAPLGVPNRLPQRRGLQTVDDVVDARLCGRPDLRHRPRREPLRDRFEGLAQEPCIPCCGPGDGLFGAGRHQDSPNRVRRLSGR